MVPALPKELLAAGFSPDNWMKRNANLEMLNVFPACARVHEEFLSRGQDEEEDDDDTDGDNELKDPTNVFLCVRFPPPTEREGTPAGRKRETPPQFRSEV